MNSHEIIEKRREKAKEKSKIDDVFWLYFNHLLLRSIHRHIRESICLSIVLTKNMSIGDTPFPFFYGLMDRKKYLFELGIFDFKIS